MAESGGGSSGGIGFVGLLTIAFVTLKVTDHIDWSWWWVLSPVWITTATVLLLIAVVIVATRLAR